MPTLKKIYLSDRADAEFVSIVDGYHEIQPTLGGRFYRDVLKYLTRIRQFPKAHPRFNEHYRYLIMQNFPYFIIYTEFEEQIIVDAIVNASQDRKDMMP